MREETVRHVMVEAVMSIGVEEPVSEALRLFTDYPLHHLPVLGPAGRLLGMLSSADMLKLEYFLPKGSAKVRGGMLNERFALRTLMRTPVITVHPEDTLAEAAARMATHAVHSLPVIDASEHLLGIITTSDIMHALLHGIGSSRRPDGKEPLRQPTELEMRRALEAAQLAARQGPDPDNIGVALLYLHARNERLEALREDVARYLHVGQDERLHSRLLMDLDALGQASPEVIL